MNEGALGGRSNTVDMLAESTIFESSCERSYEIKWLCSDS